MSPRCTRRGSAWLSRRPGAGATDFPVRWDEDNYMTRRELAKFLTLGSGLLAGVNGLIAFIGLSERSPAHARPADRWAPRRSRRVGSAVVPLPYRR